MNKKGLVPFPGDPVLSPGCVLVQHRQESSSSPAGHRKQPRGPTTIGEAVEWYTETCKSGKRSEEQIKTEALRFFILTSAEQSKDKKLL